MTEGPPILEARNLTRYFDTSEGFLDSLLGYSQQVKAVDGVDIDLHPGETLGVVGESGCGKTTLGRTLLRLIEPTAGEVRYRPPPDSDLGPAEDEEAIELTACSGWRLRRLRTDLQYIFQDPFSSLNPRLTVGDIIGEPLDVHDIATGEERTERIRDLLETVGLNASHVHRYPHEFSGGQRQRIGIARALAVDPEVIVCDEPVSALDVSVQAQILNLLADLQEEFGVAYLFIAHDLSVVEHIADRVAVMYLGEFAEVGTTEEIFSAPHHPYAEALLSAIPEPDPGWEGDRILLPGSVPSPIDPPEGCRFHTRCHRVIPPADLAIEPAEWRSLLDCKLRLAEAESVDAVTATDGASQGRERFDPEGASRGAIDAHVREAFDLPDRIEDKRAEDAFQAAVDALSDGDVQAAYAALDEPFASPCETTEPTQIHVGGTHRIRCLRYDDAAPGARPRWDGDGPGTTGAGD